MKTVSRALLLAAASLLLVSACSHRSPTAPTPMSSVGSTAATGSGISYPMYVHVIGADARPIGGASITVDGANSGANPQVSEAHGVEEVRCPYWIVTGDTYVTIRATAAGYAGRTVVVDLPAVAGALYQNVVLAR